MFKVELLTDSMQHAAIDKKRRMDLERQARIYDPKTRIMGIDVQALEDQIKCKKEAKELERQRDSIFHGQSVEMTKLLMHLDNQSAINRRVDQKSVDDYRISMQKPEERREYDLNDPKALKNDKSSLSNTSDRAAIHESGLQHFAGEDLDRASRVVEQQKQMKYWSIVGIQERESTRKHQLAEKEDFEKIQANVAAKARELQRAADDARIETAKQDRLVNENMCLAKRAKDVKARAQEYQNEVCEMNEQISGFNALNNMGNIGGSSQLRVDTFGGFIPMQDQEVTAIQNYQRQEYLTKRLNERQIDDAWANQQNTANRALEEMETKVQQKRKEDAIAIRKENESRAQVERARKSLSEKTHAFQPEFFAQFNNGSR